MGTASWIGMSLEGVYRQAIAAESHQLYIHCQKMRIYYHFIGLPMQDLQEFQIVEANIARVKLLQALVYTKY